MAEKRLAFLAVLVVAWGGGILCKLVALQVIHHHEYADRARARQEHVVAIRAQRGPIFDRGGHPLALSVPVDSVFVDPLKIPSLEVDSDLIARQLHLDPADLYQKMKTAHDNRRGFLWVKKNITPQEADNIRSLKLDWIHIDTSSERHYPNATLGAHLLGGVDFSEKGNGGLEQALEPELRGAPGEARILTDVRRRGIDELVSTAARAGTPVTTTIDEHLQFVAEREIAAAVKKHDATSGSVVVMNPYNGEILALASYPSFDPNEPPTNEMEISARSNHAVGVPFEPGSVFKVITLAAALETTKLRPDTPINCHGGVIRLYGRTIHDSHVGLFSFLSMADVLAHSSNVGAIEIGLQVGRDSMYEYVRRFGFGQRTGIPLPGESRGRLRPVERWQATSLASVAFGHEIAVTTLQLARAASVVANGGLLVKPRLVLQEGDRKLPAEAPVRAIRPETAITMRQMMEGVVLRGTGKEARLQGYTSGGKTGSAQITDASHHYTHNRYNGSFMGFAPVTNPAVVVVVTLNGTHGESGFGGASAAPVFKVVTTEALRMLDVPKDLPEGNQSQTLIADARGMDDSSGGLTDTDILDDPDDDAVITLPQGPVAPNLALLKAPVTGTVPNFKGMTLKAVLTEAQAKGIPVQPDGSGVARVQNPPPGAVLHQGERIRVQFTR